MINLCARFAGDNSGATAVEYGLIAALIGVVIIAGAGFVGTSINTQFTNLGADVTTAGS